MFKLNISDKFISKVLIITCMFFWGSALLNNCFAIPHRSVSKEQKNIIDLNKTMNKFSKKNNFDGCVFVVQNGTTLMDKAYGFSDKEQKIKTTTETKFLIGSITKQFTSLAIMQLQGKGLLNVNDTVNEYLPDLPHGDKMTIHQLLTHTSGLPCDLTDIFDFEPMPFSTDDAIDQINEMDIQLISQPGTEYNYSNLGYMVLSHIIETLSGVTYEDYIKENIFSPLEMNNSGFGYDNSITKKLALGYDSSGKLVSNKLNEEESKLLSGAGELYSTVEDLYKWDRALYTEKLISKELLEQIYSPYENNYGYGWNIISKDIYGHNGTMSGFSSCIKRLVGDNSFIVILSNDLNAELTIKIGDELTKIISD